MNHHADRPSDPGPGHHPRPASDRTRPTSARPRPPADRARPPHRPPHTQPGWRPPYPGPPVPPRPPLPPPIPAPAPETTRGVLWASVPFMTLGYGTPFSFLYAAIRRGSWGLGVTAAGYGVGTAGVLTLLQSGDPVLTVVGSFIAILLWIAGTGHAFAVRREVFPREVPRNRLNEHAIEVAKYRRSLRDEARALAAEDPALARELRIGRPDQPRAYDDGGLVDVNHAPRDIIEALPGMTPEIAGRIIARREETGGFLSAEEMAVDADVPPDVLPQMADYTIFLR
ncbi:Helix-hairpin-helix motif-containing protein [Actinomadura madurae]|uniref:Helix-hairpin-helix motif-containing protein n=2 Tax=Actinomadura madurae TaxID=1993 RepID=A0A1I5EE49_9ACTN|nr:helix-hairpin-helix domain-containing protein [Actinomadura madurae]SFO09341.1 Helix-hairpin-helix motif-containing protein [Actinomadura madurae]